MNETVTLTADWFRDDYMELPQGDEDPRDHLHEYIVSPEPLPEDWHDVGAGD